LLAGAEAGMSNLAFKPHAEPAALALPLVRHLGRVDYEPTWRTMQRFTDERGPQTVDEIWFLEHPPVFTLGLNGRREHVLAAGDIPVVHVDRGGQVTYHGPGQLVVYPLLDLRRMNLNIRELVVRLENAVIELCAGFGIEAAGRRDAPGVYVQGRKLASIGLRVRRGGTYHGIALNVLNDLEPFQRINPCGYAGLQVTRLADLAPVSSLDELARHFEPILLRHLFASHR
jgi:lipoyl(octanoyl) transferase